MGNRHLCSNEYDYEWLLWFFKIKENKHEWIFPFFIQNVLYIFEITKYVQYCKILELSIKKLFEEKKDVVGSDDIDFYDLDALLLDIF